MIRYALPAILASAGIVVHAHGAGPVHATASGTAAQENVSAGSVPVEPAPAKPRGDVLTLKSGQVIEGLQILRENSANYILGIIDGITLEIPRRQVVSVDYDDFDPKLRTRKSTMIPGQRISDTLEAKLNADISNPPFDDQDTDLVQVIGDIKARAGGALTVDTSVVDEMPPPARLWTVASEPGMTLGVLLRKKLLVDFPGLVMVFRDDEIIVTTKDAASSNQPERAGEPVPLAGAETDAGHSR